MTHPIPAAIAGMVTLWDGHADLTYQVGGRSTPLRVIDGPPLADHDDPRVLTVGIGSQAITGINSPFAGVQAAQGNTGFGHGGRRTSRHEIACQLFVWSGGIDIAAVRNDAFDTLETLGALLDASRTLGGVVDWARIVRDAYQPAQTPHGSAVSIDFTVQVEATRFAGA